MDQTQTNKKDIVQNFFMITLNGMALGLFATLIIGTILQTIGGLFSPTLNDFTKFMNTTILGGAKVLQILTGAGIGVGVALSLKLNTLQTIVLAACGQIASYFCLSTKFVTDGIINNGTFQIGDPLTIYLVVISSALLMKFVLKKKTPIDILLVPLFGIIVSLTLSLTLRFPAIYVTYAIQWIVNEGTILVPFVMGIVVSVIMGMSLTAPISSAAIASMVFSGSGEGLLLASGAAIIGCSTQMVGFMVQSRKDNPLGMVFSIGIGTSMLQFKNIIKKPIIWLPTIITSAILGPIATCVVKTKCMGSSCGMGTSGLVGQIGTFASMGNTWQTWVSIFVLEIIAPLILVYIIDLIFRKFNLIKDGDFKI